MTDELGNAHRDIELRVRVTIYNDQILDLTIFPLSSHQNESPQDLLYGYLNKRRGEFFPVRTADGQDLLLQLRNCLCFELLNDTVDQLKSQNPLTRSSITCNTNAVVAYSPIVLTLKTGRTIRGDIWFFDFQDPEDRNVASTLNEEVRYILVHAEKSTLYIRRDSIIKVGLRGALHGEDSGVSHPRHVHERCSLSEITMLHVHPEPTALDFASRVESDQTPPPIAAGP